MIPVEKADEPVEGNSEVVAMLKLWLERAQLGYLNCVAIVGCESPTVAFNDHAGVNTSHFAAYVAMDQLKQRMVANTALNTPHVRAPVEKHIPANHVAYDINNEPTQFDFLPWLITAEMTRRREGIIAPLQLTLFEGKSDVVASLKDLENRDRWITNVVIPLVRMIGAEIKDVGPDELETLIARRPSCYSFIEILEAYKAGEEIPRLQVLPEAAAAVDRMLSAERAPVVITLRESYHWPHRNSNLEEWIKLAKYLQSQDQFVLFVRDAQKANEPIEGFPICPGASMDLDLRLALYERAVCNLFVDNGPWTMALLGTRPWLAFVNADPMTGYIPNTPQWWKRNHGVTVGEQFPWCNTKQRIVWKPDTYETMRQAWDQLVVSS